jgi:hypothetical protein
MEFQTPSRRVPITYGLEPQSNLAPASVSSIIGINQRKLKHLDSIQVVRE